METKYLVIFVLLFVVATVFISTSECVPVSSDLDNQVPATDNMNAPTGQREGRHYGYGHGWPGYGGGYGGYGGGGWGGSSASAAASAAASSGGMGYGGYPYGK